MAMMTFKTKNKNKNLHILTNAQLKEIATSMSLKVNKKMVKTDLIKLIEGGNND